MQTLHLKFQRAKDSYNAGGNPFDQIADICAHCLEKLATEASHDYQASIENKDYHVFAAGGNYSRPFLPSSFIPEPEEFRRRWRSVLTKAEPQTHRFLCEKDELNRVLYTPITAFAICYDLWKPGSRKTPGTLFEIIIGSFFTQILPGFFRGKYISIPNETEKVSTDIVFERAKGSGGLVIPVKITTRERVVQPFAHQRILDSVFGDNNYKSLLVCVSEMQRDGHDNVNEICVPGTIKLFQKHLSHLTGIYYLDPPIRYLQSDLTQHVEVTSVGELLTAGIDSLL